MCKLCKAEVEHEPTAAEDYAGIRFNGLAGFKQFRKNGFTERAMIRESNERFEKEKGYPPVRVDGRDRWI